MDYCQSLATECVSIASSADLHWYHDRGGKRLKKKWGPLTSIMDTKPPSLSVAMVNLSLPHIPAPNDAADQVKQLCYFEEGMYEANCFAACYVHGGKWWVRFSAQVWNDVSVFLCWMLGMKVLMGVVEWFWVCWKGARETMSGNQVCLRPGIIFTYRLIMSRNGKYLEQKSVKPVSDVPKQDKWSFSTTRDTVKFVNLVSATCLPFFCLLSGSILFACQAWYLKNQMGWIAQGDAIL